MFMLLARKEFWWRCHRKYVTFYEKLKADVLHLTTTEIMEGETNLVFVTDDAFQLHKKIRYSDPVTGPVWPRGWVEVQLYSSMTAALEEGQWSAAHPGRTLHPGKTRYPFYRRLGGPQGRSGRAENLFPTGIRSRTVQPIVSCYTDWANGPTRKNIPNLFFGNLTHDERIFNYRLSTERSNVGTYYGILGKPSWVFHAYIKMRPEEINYIIVFACVLPGLLRQHVTGLTIQQI